MTGFLKVSVEPQRAVSRIIQFALKKQHRFFLVVGFF
jgi:hypothetical protein